MKAVDIDWAKHGFQYSKQYMYDHDPRIRKRAIVVRLRSVLLKHCIVTNMPPSLDRDLRYFRAGASLGRLVKELQNAGRDFHAEAASDQDHRTRPG